MSDSSPQMTIAWRRTRAAFVWTRILNTPFWAIYNMLPYIIFKNLHATEFQITALIILKPTVSLIALYWGSLVEKRQDRLVSNIIWGRILAHIPFFFFPFIDNPWFFILSFGFYIMLARGSEPAWMEILKLNIPNNSRERVFAYGSAIGYFGTATLPFALGSMMDNYEESWRWIFVGSALISMIAIFFKLKIPITEKEIILETAVSRVTPADKIDTLQISWTSRSWIGLLIDPWKNAFQLIKERADFRRYQLGFMIGGGGLIIIQPALPAFFMNQLDLTYTELAVALSLFKGIGFAITSPAWAKFIRRINIYDFNSTVTFLALLFPLSLIAAQYNLSWLYTGYFLYGMMQAGSEMSWSLSGPIFAKNEDSSSYSNVNILSVGLRGCIFPVIGALLISLIHPTGVMVVGACLTLISTLCMKFYGYKYYPHLHRT